MSRMEDLIKYLIRIEDSTQNQSQIKDLVRHQI